LFDVVDSGKSALPQPFNYGLTGIPVYFFRCGDCGFCFRTDWDHWTHHEFSKRIYNQDYIKFDPEYKEIRPRFLAHYFANRFSEVDRDVKILDYGSGTSNFSVAMAEFGFTSIENYDPFSNAKTSLDAFDIIVSTEVFEHLHDPSGTITDIKKLLKPDGAIFFTTLLQPPDIAIQRGRWWYAAPRNGHGAFYTRASLSILARQLQMTLWSDMASVHCFMSPGNMLPRSVLGGFSSVDPTFVLYAPDPDIEIPGIDRDQSCWHEVEEAHGLKFRWTKSSRLRWKVPRALEGNPKIRIILPTLMGVARDYPNALKVLSNTGLSTTFIATVAWYGQECHCDVELNDKWDGWIEIDAGIPVSPSPTDTRLLGIGVPVKGVQLGIPL